MENQLVTGLTCARCGKTFEAKRKTARYCSDTCKVYASQERTGRKEKVEIAIQGMEDAFSLEDLTDELDGLIAQHESLESDLSFLKEKQPPFFESTLSLFKIKVCIYKVYERLINNGYTGALLDNYRKYIPYYPFYFGSGVFDTFPLGVFENPAFTFTAYICGGNKRANTNQMLQFVQQLTVQYKMQVIYIVDSLKRYNAGFFDDSFRDLSVDKIDNSLLTVKTVKNRADTENALKRDYDFIVLDAENLNVDYDFIAHLQSLNPYASIFCTTLKPVQSIMDNATHAVEMDNESESFSFSNVPEYIDYELGYGSYFGSWYKNND